jgi:tetratricopeptide (TPR) repeat protein
MRRAVAVTVLGTILYSGGLLEAWQPTGAQLINAGRFEEALHTFQAELAADPKSLTANNGAAVALDLMGRFADARPYFAAEIKVAHTLLERAVAERAMAIGYGFAGDCLNAEKLEQRAFAFYVETNDLPNAGDVADELGRLCLESGDLDRAAQWYQRGHDTGLSEKDITQSRRDLWDFRLAHAKARIAVRRGKAAEAEKQMEKARQILDRGHIPEQQQYLPYLEGYVSFYSRDYAAASRALTSATPGDPSIACLLGQTYEALGDRARATEFYRKAAATTAHSVPAAFAQPFAKKKLASWNEAGR